MAPLPQAFAPLRLAPLRFAIERQWDGTPAQQDEVVHCRMGAGDDGLHWEIDAPDHRDPPPLGPDGVPAPAGRVAGLWAYEVVELMVLGDDGHYLEVEVGPGGHTLTLSLHGVRCVVRDDLVVGGRWQRGDGRWQASITIAAALLPPGATAVNAFAIHGADGAPGRPTSRRYLAWHPAGGQRPDFHVLEAFVPVATLLAARRARLLDGLTAIAGAASVATDVEALTAWGQDRSRAAAPAPVAVVWPRTRAHVVEILQLCGALGVPVVPSGGRTGLAGGAIASGGELVLSLARMEAIGAVDIVGRTVRVEAGATNAAVQAAAAAHGLHWPIDLASKGSATIGGNLATNAGGVRVVRYGHARDWVRGVEVVLADGATLDAGGALVKDNTGLDLRQLFIGSEGTLGVLTAATLALAPLPRASAVALLPLDGLDVALAVLRAARAVSPGPLQGAEVFSDLCRRHVQAATGRAAPSQQAPYYLLCDVDAPYEAAIALWQALAAVGGVRDVVIAADAGQARALWAWREGISEALHPRQPHKHDVAVPVAALAALVAGVDGLLPAAPGWEVAVFGHVGDGNLHVNLLPPAQGSDANIVRWFEESLYRLVVSLGGSISAEHGIGLLKRDWLALQRDGAALATMRAIKAALDPLGLLNPGKVLVTSR